MKYPKVDKHITIICPIHGRRRKKDVIKGGKIIESICEECYWRRNNIK